MAEIEPASDELIGYWRDQSEAAQKHMGKLSLVAIPTIVLLAILARLRKAEDDNANMAKLLQGYHQICSEAGIAPSSSVIYAAAERLTERAEKAERERDEARKALEEAHYDIAMYEFQSGIIRDGEWYTGGLSDAEHLARTLGLDLYARHDANLVVSMIPEAAKRRARATQGGENG